MKYKFKSMTDKKYSLSIFCLFTLSSCASSSDSISASYVSPMQYNSYSCSQLEQEYSRVASRSGLVNQQQDDIASNDAVATGVGVILFWPALFFIDSDDKKEEVAMLKGQINAIEQASISKECSSLNKGINFDRDQALEKSQEQKEQRKSSEELE